MAEKKNVTFDSIMAELRQRRYRPLYLLMGEESYYIDKIVDFIVENALTEDERDFNLTILYGADVTSAQIVETARRYPMMAERQVVIVKEAQALQETDLLAKYLDKPMPTTVLVIVNKNGSLNKTSVLYKAANASDEAVVFNSEKMKDWQLPKFIEKYFKERGATIDQKSQQMITESVGADLNRLIGEMDKLLLTLPKENPTVTPEMVEKHIGVSKDFNVFEFKDAIINRNIFKANQIMKYFDENPKTGGLYKFLPLLFSYFRNLMMAHYAPQKTDDRSVAAWLGLKSPWAAKDYMAGLRNYTPLKVMQIIHKLREVDAKSKGVENPNTDAGELMKELVFFILH